MWVKILLRSSNSAGASPGQYRRITTVTPKAELHQSASNSINTLVTLGKHRPKAYEKFWDAVHPVMPLLHQNWKPLLLSGGCMRQCTHSGQSSAAARAGARICLSIHLETDASRIYLSRRASRSDSMSVRMSPATPQAARCCTDQNDMT